MKEAMTQLIDQEIALSIVGCKQGSRGIICKTDVGQNLKKKKICLRYREVK